MNIYKISQTENDGYDTYTAAIVLAENEEEARDTHPNGFGPNGYEKINWEKLGKDPDSDLSVWASKRESVSVQYLGKADESFELPGVLLASFNAG